MKTMAWSLAGLACAALLAACAVDTTAHNTDGPAEESSRPTAAPDRGHSREDTSSPGVARPEQPADMAGALSVHAERLAAAFPATGDMRGGPVPTQRQDQGKWQMMTLMDQADVRHEAGAVEFTFMCTGSGAIMPMVMIDGHATSADELPCAPDKVAASSLTITVAKPFSQLGVQMRPSDGAVAALGYVVNVSRG